MDLHIYYFNYMIYTTRELIKIVEVVIVRSLKLFQDQPNYLCIINTHIFFNFNKNNLEWLNSMNPESIRKVHIFITSHKSINAYLKLFIEKYGDFEINGKSQYIKIIIHFPRQVRELESSLKEFVPMDNIRFYKSLVEKNGVVFVLDDYTSYYYVRIKYNDDKISVDMSKMKNYSTLLINFSEYPYDINYKN